MSNFDRMLSSEDVMRRRASLLQRLHIDGPLLILLLTLAAGSLFVLYSASGKSWDLLSKQATSFGIGLVFQIIPMIITELNAIMEAQSSRGLEIEKCSWVTKIKNYVTFSFPLLFRVISKGQAISLAMHYYQLNFSVHRTAYKNIKASKYDVYFILANAVAIAATIVLHIFFYIPV